MKKRLLAAMMVLGMTLGLAQMPVMAESTELTTEAAAAQTETSATEAAGTEANAEETEQMLRKRRIRLRPRLSQGRKRSRFFCFQSLRSEPWMTER